MKAAEIMEILRRRHPSDKWAYITELKTATGTVQAAARSGIFTERYIDAFAMHLWPSKDFMRIAYEIKVSREDWVKELQDPYKRVQAVLLANKFYFVLAPGILKQLDIKHYKLWHEGILEIQEDGAVKTIQGAVHHGAYPMPEWFIASLLRNAYRSKWGNPELDGEVKELYPDGKRIVEERLIK